MRSGGGQARSRCGARSLYRRLCRDRAIDAGRPEDRSRRQSLRALDRSLCGARISRGGWQRAGRAGGAGATPGRRGALPLAPQDVSDGNAAGGCVLGNRLAGVMGEAARCPGIQIDGLTLRFGTRTIFENLSLDIPGGRITALLGTSGVGKTSLLKILAGLAQASHGTVRAGDGGLLAGRVAYMAQTDLLYPWLRVIDNVMLGSRLRRERRDAPRAMHLLERVGLADRARALP